MRRRAIEKELKLDELLKTARAMELSNDQVQEYEHANFISTRKPANNHQRRSAQPTLGQLRQQRNGQRDVSHQMQQSQNHRQKNNNSKECGLCGGIYPHKKECPAKGKNCLNCGKLNHLAKVCRSKQQETKRQGRKERVFEVSDEYPLPDNDNLSDEFVGNIESNHFVFNVNKLEIQSCPTFDITIEGSKLNVLADSGATINLMSYQTFRSLKNNPYLVTIKCKCVCIWFPNPPQNHWSIHNKNSKHLC